MTVKRLVYSFLSGEQVARFEKDLEIDLSFGVEGLGRFRTNVFLQRGTVASVLRMIPYQIRGFEELGLPVEDLRGDLQPPPRPRAVHRAPPARASRPRSPR